MLAVLANRWHVLALRGVCAVLIGIAALLWPGATLLTLVMLFGAYALASGILSGVLAFTGQPPRPRWLLVIEAVVGVAAGVIALTQVGITTVSLVVVLGVFGVVAGISRLMQAITLRKEIEHEWLLGASGALTVLLGLLMLAWPVAGAFAIAWTLGFMAIVLGINEVALGLKLRSLAHRVPAGLRV